MRRRPFNRLSALIMLIAVILISGFKGRAQIPHTERTIITTVPSVPEPSRVLLLVVGVLPLLLRRRRC